MKNFIFLIGIVLLITGCATTAPIKTTNDVFTQSKIDIDSYQKTTWIKSPYYEEEGILQGVGIHYVWLRAKVENKKVSFYQIYVNDRDDDWRFFHSAYDSNGKELTFIKVDSEVTSNWCEEDYIISVDRKYLDASVGKGINFKAVGQRGSRIVAIPSFYIEGFLKKVDEYIGGAK